LNPYYVPISLYLTISASELASFKASLPNLALYYLTPEVLAHTAILTSSSLSAIGKLSISVSSVTFWLATAKAFTTFSC